jgi:hypothetical protein
VTTIAHSPARNESDTARQAVDDVCGGLGSTLDLLHAAQVAWRERSTFHGGDPMVLRDLRRPSRHLEDVAGYRAVSDVIAVVWRIELSLRIVAHASYLDRIGACRLLQRISDTTAWSRPVLRLAERLSLVLPPFPGAPGKAFGVQAA